MMEVPELGTEETEALLTRLLQEGLILHLADPPNSRSVLPQSQSE